MRIAIEREDFLRTLSRTQGVVDRRHSMAILTNVLIEADGESVAAIATDLEVSLRQRCPARVEDPGRVAVSARKLFEIVRESTSDEIVLRTLENQWVGIEYGRSSFKLMGIDPADHPGMPTVGDGGARFELGADELSDMIHKTIFAVSQDDTRSNLAGVHVDKGLKKGWLRFVATDGHRLALIDKKAKGGPLAAGAILPRKGLSEVAKIVAEHTGTVTLTLTEAEAVIDLGDSVLSMRLVEGSFPDYNQVVPKDTKNVARIERDALLQTVRRVSLLSSERARGVRLALSDSRIEIRAQNPDLGEATEDLEIEYAGDDVEIGFNARYLLDVLAVLPEGGAVELGLGDQLSPGILRGEDEAYTYVVMPMRI